MSSVNSFGRFLFTSFFKPCIILVHPLLELNLLKYHLIMRTQESNLPPTLWSKKEASKHLCCSIKTIDRLIKDGRIRAFKMGKKVLIYANSCIEENINAIKPKFKN